MAKSPYIIIVDDDVEDAQLLAEELRRKASRIQIEIFTTCEEAVHSLGERKAEDMPVLLVTDYKMPFISGPELLAILKADGRYSKTVKVVISTSGNKRHIEECLQLGADKYFMKPNDLVQLSSIADAIIGLFCGKLLSETGFGC